MTQPEGPQEGGRPTRPDWWVKDFWKFGKYARIRSRIQAGLEIRYSLLDKAINRITQIINNEFADDPTVATRSEVPLPPISILQLATIDVYVEKAQDYLTQRAKTNEFWAVLASFSALVVMGGAACAGAYTLLLHGDPCPSVLGPSPTPDQINAAIRGGIQNHCVYPQTAWTDLLFAYLGKATILGLLLGIAYFFVALARALFHEATILKNRRHSVRLGRMYLHLKVLSANSEEGLAKVIGQFSVDDLERCFGWNLETSTAFKDIRPEAMTTTLTGQIFSTLQKGIDAIASLKKP